MFQAVKVGNWGEVGKGKNMALVFHGLEMSSIATRDLTATHTERQEPGQELIIFPLWSMSMAFIRSP